MKMSPPSILIVGAGELGTAVLEALLSHPKRDNAKIGMLRRASTLNSPNPTIKAENNRLTSLGITLEEGDFVSSPLPSLTAVFKNYHTIIQCAGFGLPPGTQTRVTDAILQAGVPRYFPWQFGLDYPSIGQGSQQDLFDEMLLVREKLATQSKTSWTVVSTGLFMSFLLNVPEFGVVDLKQRKVTALGGWGNRVTVTAPGDIGRMVAEMVYVPEGTVDEVVFVAGDTVSYGEVADVLERVYGVEFERGLLSLENSKVELEGKPDDGMAKYRGVFSAGKGTAWDMERTVNHQRGIELMSLEEYVRGNRST